MSQRLTFIDHLEELRTRLLVVLAVTGIFTFAAYFFSKPLLEFLTSPLKDLSGGGLYFNAPYEAFVVRLKVALFGGLIASSPVFFAELWLFLVPGLHRRERKLAAFLISSSILLFLVGAAFAFWFLIPWGLRFLLGFETDSLRPLLGIEPYFSFLMGMVLASGIVFNVPVVLLGLVRGRILGPEALRRARRWVIVLIFVVTAVLTPTPDPVGQTLLALPLILLYEVCVWAARWVERKEKK